MDDAQSAVALEANFEMRFARERSWLFVRPRSLNDLSFESHGQKLSQKESFMTSEN